MQLHSCRQSPQPHYNHPNLRDRLQSRHRLDIWALAHCQDREEQKEQFTPDGSKFSSCEPTSSSQHPQPHLGPSLLSPTMPPNGPSKSPIASIEHQG
ncbi:hypothetical protein NL676_020777 [Syzygium grande]|nr:hypothetical protein NL676_020777 [Syzygium grande]